MNNLPTVTWITPTYRRPQTLANLIACFLGQDYPPELLNLIILDDAGQYGPDCRGDRWEVISFNRRFHSLPAKFNALAGMTGADVIIVAEDDDSFLSHHTKVSVDACGDAGWSKPSEVLTDYPGHIITERADGRFHGSLAFNRVVWEAIGGWPVSHQANFDQQMIRRLDQFGPPGDPVVFASPSYIFRWHTGHYHGQSTMDTPGDQEWYVKAAQDAPVQRVDRIVPQFDILTESFYAPIHAG